MHNSSLDNEYFLRIKKGDVYAFEHIFKSYYSNLCIFAEHYVKEKHMAEEIVGNVFLNLWEKRNIIQINGSFKSYIYGSVHNHSIKYLEHLKVMLKYKDYAENVLKNKEMLAPSSGYPLANLISKEVTGEIEKAINDLPEKCKEVFCLSRFEDMSYEEISKKLNISLNTVRTQITRALQKLRETLKDHLPLYIIILYLFTT